jgi:16S rRNA (cytidine1402-2'-O)-methyltransferase
MLYLVPNSIDIQIDENAQDIPYWLQGSTLNTIQQIHYWAVETPKTARKFLSLVFKPINVAVNGLHIIEMNDVKTIETWLKNGYKVGLLSDAGCPAVADPGSKVVRLSHQLNIQVMPLIGPSSILLSVMASGLSGQNFRFLGYIPKNTTKQYWQELHQHSLKNQETQLFIETPYKNRAMIETLCQHLPNPDQTWCLISGGLYTPHQFIKTQTVSQLKHELNKNNKELQEFLDLKIPTIFGFLAEK